MKNNDYKVEFEEHRREIELDRNEDMVLPSRAERHGRGRKRKNTSRYTTINIILGIFTFIPILIFVYVIYNFYFGATDTGSAKVDNLGTHVEFNTNESPGKNEGSGSLVVGSDKEKDDKNQSNQDADKETSAESKEESNKPPVNVNPPVIESGVSKETETPKVEEKPKADEKPKTENPPQDNSKAKTHTVAANETLYRISMNYYGSDAGVEKIKKANGLSSNNIVVGQKLIIP